jgi:hypothetical protein
MKPHFFIGGAVKSGTTWLQVLLDSHPQLACRGEGHLVSTLLPMLELVSRKYGKQIDRWNQVLFSEIAGFPRLREEDTVELMRTAASLLFRQYSSDPRVLAIGEKTPANVLHFAQLTAIFPGSRCIHMVRDGRDCTVSNWYQALRTRPGWIDQQFGGEFARYVDHYAPVWERFTRTGSDYVHAHPESSWQLRYEDLKVEPHQQVKALLEFLGVASDVNTVQQCVEKASFKNQSGGRKSGEEDRQSFFRKGESGGWKELFDEDSLARFRKHAPGLELLGYS